MNIFTVRHNVPNAPCGVERQRSITWYMATENVPNAPCGVERGYKALKPPTFYPSFLMHRVELKEAIKP